MMSASPDSYSRFERSVLAPARRVLEVIYWPVVRLLAALHVSPNLVSLSQVVVGAVVVALIPAQPRLAFVLFVVAVSLDGVDGALARATNRVTKFGGLLDQYCDHVREVTVVAGLALHGALNPLLAGLYGVGYPALNLTLYLCNLYLRPVPLALKSYLTLYPALFVFLWFGVNVLDAAVGLSIALMGSAIVQGLWRLRKVMDPGA